MWTFDLGEGFSISYDFRKIHFRHSERKNTLKISCGHLILEKNPVFRTILIKVLNPKCIDHCDINLFFRP